MATNLVKKAESSKLKDWYYCREIKEVKEVKEIWDVKSINIFSNFLNSLIHYLQPILAPRPYF